MTKGRGHDPWPRPFTIPAERLVLLSLRRLLALRVQLDVAADHDLLGDQDNAADLEVNRVANLLRGLAEVDEAPLDFDVRGAAVDRAQAEREARVRVLAERT